MSIVFAIPVRDYPNYEVRDDGSVFRIGRNQPLNIDKYGTVVLYNEQGMKVMKLSRIVYSHFATNGHKLEDQLVHHINKIKSDNRIENLTIRNRPCIRKLNLFND